MTRPLSIHIPEPCHQDWDSMQPNTTGRFCSSCQKSVIDFTVLSDEEILQHLKQATSKGQGICARVMRHQTRRPLIVPNAPVILNGWSVKSGKSTWSGWPWLLAAALLTVNNMPPPMSVQPHSDPKLEFEYTPSFTLLPQNFDAQTLSMVTMGFTVTRIVHDSIPQPDTAVDFLIPPLASTPDSDFYAIAPPIDATTLDSAKSQTEDDNFPITGGILSENIIEKATLDTLPKTTPFISEQPTIYPNPAPRSSLINIKTSSTNIRSISLYNISGTLIQTKEFETTQSSQSLSFQLPPNLTPGIYIIRSIASGNVQISSTKLLIE